MGDSSENRRVKAQYDKAAQIYDVVDWLIPGTWRRKATGLAYGRVLEVGVGTGLNLPYYSEHCQEILGIDVSPLMLEQATKRVPYCKAAVRLEVMDVQELPLDSGSFDCVLVAFVFCTVPDPVQGLRECCRVLKSGGRLILLEHMGSDKRLLRRFMDGLSPFVVSFMGDHINRRTAESVAAAGFGAQTEENLFGDVVRLIAAE